MKSVVLGSHKGLGFECVKALLNNKKITHVLGYSRHDCGEFNHEPRYQFKSYDFTKAYEDLALFENLFSDLESFEPDCIIYCAGGGPHGEFASKHWKDHEWAIKLNFLFPAKLLWALGQVSKKTPMEMPKTLKFVYVGSAIAESEGGDKLGPSYAAAKWAMKGLWASIKNNKGSENQKYQFEFTWINPGYMDTDLLPPRASPRHSGEPLLDPKNVAYEILSKLGI